MSGDAAGDGRLTQEERERIATVVNADVRHGHVYLPNGTDNLARWLEWKGWGVNVSYRRPWSGSDDEAWWAHVQPSAFSYAGAARTMHAAIVRAVLAAHAETEDGR